MPRRQNSRSTLDEPSPATRHPANRARTGDMFEGGGKMGVLVRETDWSKTPLGPIESWPSSLRTTVSLCLASTFPIDIIWGSERVQIYNDGYWPICGAKHPGSMGQDFKACWLSAWPVIGDAFEQATAGHATFIEDSRIFIDRNGYLEETFFTFSFSPIRDEAGRVAGVFHPVTEITQATLAARRLKVLRDLADRTADARAVEEVCALIADTLDHHELDLPFVALYLLEDEGRRARRASLTGLSADTAVTPSVMEVTAAAIWPLGQAIATGQVMEVSRLSDRFLDFVCRPYPEPPSSAFVLPLSAPGIDRPLGVLIAGVSARLALDEPHRLFYSLLRESVTSALTTARAYEEERHRAEALAALDRAKTAFFSNVSHEFRTPLTLILGPVQDLLTESGTLAPAGRAQIEVIHRNSLRLLKLVNTLLDFSRIEAGRARANYQPTDLATFTTDLASSFRSACDRAGLALVVRCQPLPQPVYVDRDMWENIVLNLVSNAFKFTLEGRVEVTLDVNEGCARLVVTDTGVGIPAAELPRTFERFHRVPRTQGRTHEGTGIGLALVRELVKLHGGDVHVDSILAEGTSFTVTVPFGTAHLDARCINQEAGLGSTGTGPEAFVEEALRWLPDPGDDAGLRASGSTDASSSDTTLGVDRRLAQPDFAAHILVVDDNADMRDYLRRVLADRWAVTLCGDAQSALTAAQAHPPDLIVADIMMPRMDGFELLRAIRDDGRTSAVPVILLSARAGEDARIDGVQAGADDYIVKPFSARELHARVEAQIARGHLQRDLIVARRAAESANRVRDEFLITMSHELRTPLNAILGWSRLLEISGTAAPASIRARDSIERNARALAALIDDLLDVSRMMSDTLRIEREPVDFGAAIEAAVDTTLPAMVAHGITLDLSLDPSARSIRGDRPRLEQIVSNLLTNAIKFTPAGGQISVSLTLTAGDSQLVVADSGAGISADVLPLIFEPFWQADSSASRRHGGLGLGLAIVRQLVALHDGTIRAESEPGQGSRFIVTLPGQTTNLL